MQTFAIAAIEKALRIARARCGARPPVVGIAGAQGGGKSWLARDYAAATPSAVNLSLDDFYLSPASRRALAESVHPLFATRGVPGTHDLALLNATLDALLGAGPDARTPLPAFDKLRDDIHPHTAWRNFNGRPEAIILEGWCLGALPQSLDDLAAPVNALERDEDCGGVWRRAVNAHLASDYAALFARLDAIVFLKAPWFDIVHAWRCQQEETALGRPLTDAERQRIARFISFFERITCAMLAGLRRSDLTLELDGDRQVLHVRRDV